MFEVSVLERAAAADAAVGDEIGRPDAEQVARTEVAVAVDADVFDRRVVVLLGVVERLFAEIGIVGPSADRISPFEDAIVDRDAVDFGVAPVRVVGSPRDEGDRLAAARIDVAVAGGYVADRIVGVRPRPPPQDAARVVVSAPRRRRSIRGTRGRS